ncbi:MAG: helix-turn-helix domain-containing protein [Gemmatimonadaceae bacterium]
MSGWIGRDLEQLRRLRGLRREDVAAQLSLSPSTIRNIEHDETYNVSLDLLRQVAEVVGATVRISLEISEKGGGRDDAASDAFVEKLQEDRRVVTNERFIRRVREHYPECPLTNSQIGRRMWQFAHSRGAVLMKGRKPVRPALSPSIVSYRVPTTSAEYSVTASDVDALDRFADRLGRAYKDKKGQVLVPVK